MKHTLVAWMRDKPGVLNRVSGMLRRRNFNIDSLQVGHSETPGISRMTFVVDGNAHMVDQVIKQLRKVIDVTRVEDISEKPSVIRELALIRVATTSDNRAEIMQLVSIYGGEVVDVTLESLVVQVVGVEERVDALLDLLASFGIIEMVRTGRVAITRGTVERKIKRGTTVWKARSNGFEPDVTERFRTGGV
jgi:acetolactate synthase I/III small subunit